MSLSTADVLQIYLVGEGIVNNPGGEDIVWPAYVGALPDGDRAPDNAVALMDTTPTKDGRLMAGSAIFHPGIQILLRAKDYRAGFAKAEEIQTKLEEVRRTEVSVDSLTTYRVDNASPTTGVVVVGQEQETTKRRWMFSANFLVTIKEM